MPYGARMCVKDSFVKCWQQPQQALPSQSSPPTRPGARQGSPAQPGLSLGPPGRAGPSELGHSGAAALGAGILSTPRDTQELGHSAHRGTLSTPWDQASLLPQEHPAGAELTRCALPAPGIGCPKPEGFGVPAPPSTPKLLS